LHRLLIHRRLNSRVDEGCGIVFYNDSCYSWGPVRAFGALYAPQMVAPTGRRLDGRDRMKILIVHGPNLNMLGQRDPAKYGTITMSDINYHLQFMASDLACEIDFFQSNHEGEIIDFLQLETSRMADGVVINPGALVRYGYCLRQAFIDLGKPVIEVHMSDIHRLGINTSVNVLDDVRIDQIVGLKEESYYQALERLVRHLEEKR
jgi:3-dehydroquinate dehydratase-2